MKYHISGASLLSEWAPAALAVESTNLITKSSPFFINNFVVTRELTVKKDHLKSCSMMVLDASIDLKLGSIRILSDDECASSCNAQRESKSIDMRRTKSKCCSLQTAGVPPQLHSGGRLLVNSKQAEHICNPAVLHAGCSYLGRSSKAQSEKVSIDRFVACESMWLTEFSSSLLGLDYYASGEQASLYLTGHDGTAVGAVVGILHVNQHKFDLESTTISSKTRTEEPAYAVTIAKREEVTKEETLQEIVNIVREILQCDDIDPEETFFEAGIDSLTSLQLRATLQDKLKMQLPGTLINDYPTAMSLCEMIANSKQYKAIYLPPLYDADSDNFRQIPSCLPRWYQILMWPSKKLFEMKDGLSFPLQDGVYRVQPLTATSGPARYAACSTVDINVAWTRMRSTYYFKGGISDTKLIESLSPVLDAFPSLTSRLVERRGDLYFEYGGSNAHVEVRTGFATQWTPQDYIGMVIPGIWKLTIAVWLWQFLYSNIGIALFLAWRAYTSLFGSPLMRVRITHIVKEESRKASFWQPLLKGRERQSPDPDSEIVGTYLTVDWMHSVADGGTMGRFMSLWAMAFRDEPLLVSHPGPLNALNQRQKELFTRLWLNESPVPRLYRPLRGVGLNYVRFLIPNTTIEAAQERCRNAVRTSDVVVATMWEQLLRYANLGERLARPKITFLEDLRQHIPELQPFAGNLIRFLPPLVPDVGAGGETGEETHISQVADLIFNHRKMDHFKMSELEDTGGLSGIPCCWSALHNLINSENCPMIMVNDLIPFDAPIRFDDDHVGIVPAEASGWRPDIPCIGEGVLDSFAEIPNWQIWLTRGPDGVVVSLFSMP